MKNTVPNPLEHTYKSLMAVGTGTAVMLGTLIYLAVAQPDASIAEGLFRVVTPLLLGVAEASRQWRLEDKMWEEKEGRIPRFRRK